MSTSEHGIAPAPSDGASHCIAIVAGDALLRERLARPLRTLGFNVLEFEDAQALLSKLGTGLACEVAVVSAAPDSGDPEPLVRHLRERTDTGIVVVGPQGDPSAAALGYVADAFFQGPVDAERIAMLVAALDNLQRRLQSRVRKDEQAAPDWRLAADGWSLRTPEGVAIPLGDAERKVLLEMAAGSATGTPVAHEALIRALTPDVYDYDPHRLEMLIHRLRKKAALVTPHPLPLRAIRARGYLCNIRIETVSPA